MKCDSRHVLIDVSGQDLRTDYTGFAERACGGEQNIVCSELTSFVDLMGLSGKTVGVDVGDEAVSHAFGGDVAVLPA